MGLGSLFEQVKNAIMDHSNQQQHTGFNPSGLLGQVEGLFGSHAQNNGQNVRPASEDPMGDPADQMRNVRPASEDPRGDPADQMNVRHASEDPLGDPADRR